MKRGLITWDKTEIAPAAFEQRIDKVRRVLSDRNLSALVVYSDLWRSNQARFFSNFSPYFNRALLIIPVDQPSTLLCGLSPRTYSWIRSVTTIEDVRPAGNFARPLFQIASERSWTRVGILDWPHLPFDMYKAIGSGPVEIVNVESAGVFAPAEDETELDMRRKAATMAREILASELPKGVGSPDHHLAGRLERSFRRNGAEDLVILLTNGITPPATATGAPLEQNYSVSLALENHGHWIRISRPHGSPQVLQDCKRRFEKSLTGQHPSVENLAGSYPYEMGAGSIFAIHVEVNANGKRLFYGDTCRVTGAGPQIL